MNRSILLKHICILSVCLVPFFSSAQKKFEKESGISASKVPTAAKEFLQTCTASPKTKWYVQVDQKGKYIEAKFRQGGARFSVLFDTTGNIVDIEKQVKLSELPEAERNAVKNSLDKQYSKYSIRKIQQQFTGVQKNLCKCFDKEMPTNSAIVRRYEIELSTRKNNTPIDYEVLLSPEGKIISSVEIIHRSANNMIY